MPLPNGIYIKRGSRVLGPFSVKQQRHLYGLGKISDHDLVSPNKIGPWIQFRQFNGDEPNEAEATVTVRPPPVKRSSPNAPRVASEDFDKTGEQTQRARSQPKSRKHDCFQCGHSFASFASACPQCGTRRPKHAPPEADDAGTEDNDFASLTEAVAMAEKLPGLPPRRKKQKADKRTNRKRDTTRLGIWHLIKEVVSQNSSIFYPTMMLTIVVAGVVGVVQFLNLATKSKPGISGREQKEFMHKTTAKWIELEKEDMARRSEVLWRDNRWMPLISALGVDWAALPDWFDALQHPKAHDLAEEILQKWTAAEGHPYPEDLIAGLKSPNQRVQYWSIVIIKGLRHQKDKDARISELERFRDGGNKELADAAVQTLQAIRPGPVNGGVSSAAGNPVAPAIGDQTVKVPDTTSPVKQQRPTEAKRQRWDKAMALGAEKTRAVRLSEALAAFEIAWEASQELVNVDPSAAEFQIMLSQSHHEYGMVLFLQEKYREANLALNRELKILETLKQQGKLPPTHAASIAEAEKVARLCNELLVIGR